MCGDGKTEREVRRRVQAGVNAYIAVEGVMETGSSQKTEGQGHEHLCHTGMSVRNGKLGTDRTTPTKAASVRKQLGPKIARVTRADRRRVVELREETGCRGA